MISTYTEDMKITGLTFKLFEYLKKFSSESDSNLDQPQTVLEDETPSAPSTHARTSRPSNVIESSLCFVCNTRQKMRMLTIMTDKKEDVY